LLAAGTDAYGVCFYFIVFLGGGPHCVYFCFFGRGGSRHICFVINLSLHLKQHTTQTQNTAAYRGETLREVSLADEEEESTEAAAAGGVGLAVHKKARAGGLGKMRDYGKRQAEVPNPYAPPQVCFSCFIFCVCVLMIGWLVGRCWLV
jgi:hypothetical protein